MQSTTAASAATAEPRTNENVDTVSSLLRETPVKRGFAIADDGCRIYYEWHRAGDYARCRVVMLMGITMGMSAWQEELTMLLSNDVECLLIDNRGSGLSDKPHKRYTTGIMAKDCRAALYAAGWLDVARIGNTKFSILGISMGGMVGLELAYLLRNQVASVILISTCAKFKTGIRHIMRMLYMFFAPGTPRKRMTESLKILVGDHDWLMRPAQQERRGSDLFKSKNRHRQQSPERYFQKTFRPPLQRVSLSSNAATAAEHGDTNRCSARSSRSRSGSSTRRRRRKPENGASEPVQLQKKSHFHSRSRISNRSRVRGVLQWISSAGSREALKARRRDSQTNGVAASLANFEGRAAKPEIENYQGVRTNLDQLVDEMLAVSEADDKGQIQTSVCASIAQMLACLFHRISRERLLEIRDSVDNIAICSGTNDRVISFSLSQEMYEQLTGQKIKESKENMKTIYSHGNVSLTVFKGNGHLLFVERPESRDFILKQVLFAAT